VHGRQLLNQLLNSTANEIRHSHIHT